LAGFLFVPILQAAGCRFVVLIDKIIVCFTCVSSQPAFYGINLFFIVFSLSNEMVYDQQPALLRRHGGFSEK